MSSTTDIESTKHLATLVAEAIQDDVRVERVKEVVPNEIYSFACSDQDGVGYNITIVKTTP